MLPAGALFWIQPFTISGSPQKELRATGYDARVYAQRKELRRLFKIITCDSAIGKEICHFIYHFHDNNTPKKIVPFMGYIIFRTHLSTV